MVKQEDDFVRMNLRVPKDVKEWLYEASFRESTATRRMSATSYLVELVRSDRDDYYSHRSNRNG
jgi:hypothetical protein